MSLSTCLTELMVKWSDRLKSHNHAFINHAGLEETQAGIKIAGRNISNLKYADNTTLMAESEEEL